MILSLFTGSGAEKKPEELTKNTASSTKSGAATASVSATPISGSSPADDSYGYVPGGLANIAATSY